jgi:3-hydroxyisobutyrate dehydrogenase-like beta-hydroxyacid dehydrogenase
VKFGTIGAGTVAFAFAREAVATGHEVVLSSRRGPESLASKVAELGHGASAATVEEAASLDYVLLAVPWPNVEDALRRLPAWNGRGFFLNHPDIEPKIHAALRETVPLVASGAIQVPIAATYPLSSLREAVLHAQRGGKVLLNLRGTS